MNGSEHPDELILQPFGVGELEERVYRMLLRDPALSAADLKVRLEVTRAQLSAALQRLQDLGLVSRHGKRTASFVAVSPELVVETLFSVKKGEIERARMRGAVLRDEYETNKQDKDLYQILTIIDSRAAMRRYCKQLQRDASKEVLLFERPPYSAPATSVDASLDALGNGALFRTIYEPAALEVEGHAELVEQSIAAGEQARIYPALPLWMLIVDGHTGLVPLQASQHAAGGAVLIHSSWLLDALITLFEAIWDRAIPLPQYSAGEEAEQGSPLSDQDRTLLTMLAAGVKDSTISRELGIDPTTVRRRIRRLARRLGAETRFQIGMMAAKRGWI